MEVQVFLALMHGLRLARRRGRAGLDAVFQRPEVGVGEIGDGSRGQLGLEQTTDGVDLRHIEYNEVQLRRDEQALAAPADAE